MYVIICRVALYQVWLTHHFYNHLAQTSARLIGKNLSTGSLTHTYSLSLSNFVTNHNNPIKQHLILIQWTINAEQHFFHSFCFVNIRSLTRKIITIHWMSVKGYFDVFYHQHPLSVNDFLHTLYFDMSRFVLIDPQKYIICIVWNKFMLITQFSRFP